MPNALLLAEPEPELREYLERQLAGDGFDVLDAPPHDVLAHAERARPDLLLLGARAAEARRALELCSRLRAGEPGRTWDRALPVILLGAEGADAVERARALAHGADDVVSRPIVYDELLARIRAVLRRAQPGPGPERLEVGELQIDRAARRVEVGGVRVPLAGKQFDLLWELARDPERVVTKAELLRAIWGSGGSRTRAVDTYASRLRRALTVASPEPYVVNVWGVGYRLRE